MKVQVVNVKYKTLHEAVLSESAGTLELAGTCCPSYPHGHTCMESGVCAAR